MGSRGQKPHAYEGRSAQAPGMMRHGSFVGRVHASGRPMESFSPSELLENKVAVQAAEIDRLAGDNHRLAATDMALREDLNTAQQDIQRLRAHLRSIQTESDIQLRVLLDKIAKMEVDVRAGASVREELEQAHMEARSLVTGRQELIAEIKQLAEDLEKTRADVKKLPELHAELDNLREEYHVLRNTFEKEKGQNIEKVEQLRAMETNLVGVAREMETLRAEVANAEKRALVPNHHGGPYVNQNPSVPPPMPGTSPYINQNPHPMPGTGPYINQNPLVPPHPMPGTSPYVNHNNPPVPPMPGTGPFVDSYGRPVPIGVGAAGEGNIPYGGVDGAPVPVAGGNAFWRGT